MTGTAQVVYILLMEAELFQQIKSMKVTGVVSLSVLLFLQLVLCVQNITVGKESNGIRQLCGWMSRRINSLNCSDQTYTFIMK